MLVLSRKKGQSIILKTQGQEKIKIVIVSTGNQVRVGVEANKSVLVAREEIELVEKEKKLVI